MVPAVLWLLSEGRTSPSLRVGGDVKNDGSAHTVRERAGLKLLEGNKRRVAVLFIVGRSRRGCVSVRG